MSIDPTNPGGKNYGYQDKPGDKTLKVYPFLSYAEWNQTQGRFEVAVATVRDPRQGTQNIGQVIYLSDVPISNLEQAWVLMTYDDAVAAGMFPTGEINMPV